jgi:hypothetical protein
MGKIQQLKTLPLVPHTGISTEFGKNFVYDPTAANEIIALVNAAIEIINAWGGVPGPKGDTGDTGARGDKGEKGDTGNIGLTGPRGERGETGATGVKGDKGDKGDTGEIGPRGITGSPSFCVYGSRASIIGKNQFPQESKIGDTGIAIAITDTTMYVSSVRIESELGANFNVSYILTKSFDIQGPKGDVGATGDTGPRGEKGDAGAKGDKGDKGDTGDIGPRGERGEKGEPGQDADTTDKVSKSGDTMTGNLDMQGIAPTIKFSDANGNTRFRITSDMPFRASFTIGNMPFTITSSGQFFASTYTGTLGTSANKWATTFSTKLNNGADIEIPAKAGTLALLSDIEDALGDISTAGATGNPQGVGLSIVDYAYGQSGTNYDRASFEEYSNGRIDQRCRLHFGSFNPYGKSMIFNLPKEMPDAEYIAVATIKNKGNLGAMVQEQTTTTITIYVSTMESPGAVPDVYVDLVIYGSAQQ